MKSIKIIIILVVVLLIGIACYHWMKDDGKGGGETIKSEPEDKYNWMKRRIDTFGALADTIIYKSEYAALKFDIETRGSALEFAPNDSDLNQTRKNDLLDMLYMTYISELIKTANLAISNGSDKESLILNLIKEVEYSLTSSSLNDEDKKNELKDILATLNKYTEIKQFIAKANTLTLSNAGSKPGIYDILQQTELESDFIIPQRSYLADMTFPVNCPHIKKDLENVSVILFKKSVNFFISKISQLSKKEWGDGLTKNDFSMKYLPAIKSQLNSFNNIYGIDDGCFTDIKSALDDYAQDIYTYNNPYKDPCCI